MRKIKLGDILDVKRGTSLSGEFYAEEGDKIRLTLGNFNYPLGGFKENTSKRNIYFSGDVKEEFILKKGDIITPLTEQVSGLLGETARIPEDDLYIQSGDIGLVIPNEKLLNRLFAYYLLSSPIVKKQLDLAAQQTKIRHTSPEKIKDCDVWLPDMEHQKHTGVLLDTINQKIENNNKINVELELIAKTIYNYWFLQFEFPNEEGKPYKSSGGKMVWNDELKREIPEGWKVDFLGHLFTSNRGISYNSKTIEGNGVPMINLASFNVDGSYKEEGIKVYSGEYSEEKVVKPFDLLMCNTQQTAIDYKKDIIGKAFLVPDIFEGDIVTSHHVTTIQVEKDNVKYFLHRLFNTDYFHKYAAGFTNGTNILGLIFSGIEKYKLEIPDDVVLSKFADLMLNIEMEKSKIIKENQELISLRDFLLPLLMNGQVGFNE